MGVAINTATTFSAIPKFVPFGVLWYTEDTDDLYIGTGSSVGPAVTFVAGGGSGGSGVSSLNSLTGAVTIVAGTNVTVTTAGSNVTISSTGGGAAGSTGAIQYNVGGGVFAGSGAVTDSTGDITMPVGSVMNAYNIIIQQTDGTPVGNISADASGDVAIGDSNILGDNTGCLDVGTLYAGTVSVITELVMSTASLSDSIGSTGSANAILTSGPSGGEVVWGGVRWSVLSGGGGSGSPTIINNGNAGTVFQQINSGTVWEWQTTKTATSTSANSSPILEVVANYWNGTSAADIWSIQGGVAAGTNGATTLTIGHSGSSGAAVVVAPAFNSINAYQANGTAGVTQTAETVGTLATINGIVTTFTAVSDERLKIHKPYGGGLNEILDLTPITYRWNSRGQEISGQSGDKDYVGFSAQNVQKNIPEAVWTGTRHEFLCFDDRPVIAALVNAVKELEERLRKLEPK